MELRQLRTFVSVADHGSVTHAAQALLIAQPSVSAQIHALEDELGQPLFDRLPRGVRLTEAGEVVLTHARRVLREIDEIERGIDELRGLRRGRLVLGTIPTITDQLIATVVKTFRERFPAVDLSVVEARSSVLAEGVASHRLDLAVVTILDERPPVDLEHLVDEELVAVVAAGDPLAGRREVDLGELADRPFLLLETGFGLRSVVWNACRAAGFTPRVAMEMESVQAIKGLVQIGMGVSLVPRMTAALEVQVGLLHALRVRSQRLTRPIQVATARGAHLTRAAQAFIAICREQAANAGRAEGTGRRERAAGRGVEPAAG